jgi:two-component system, cell cycle response regulator DivK
MKTKILIIEDNDQNLYLVTFLLENSGFEVVQAKDGPTGVEYASKIKPDLILLDIQLPGMDGYTVAKEIRANPELKNINIVAVTSYAMMGDREQAFAAGCAGYIEKPINPETFISQITKFLPEAKGGVR